MRTQKYNKLDKIPLIVKIVQKINLKSLSSKNEVKIPLIIKITAKMKSNMHKYYNSMFFMSKNMFFRVINQRFTIASVKTRSKP